MIPPIVLGLYFCFLSSLFGNIEFFYKKNIFVTIATSSAAILNIVLNAIFIPIYGFVAAGYTTAFGYLVLACAHYLFMKRIQPEKIYDTKMILIISAIVVVLTFLIVFLYNYYLIRYIIAIIILLICLLNIKKVIDYIKLNKEMENCHK